MAVPEFASVPDAGAPTQRPAATVALPPGLLGRLTAITNWETANGTPIAWRASLTGRVPQDPPVDAAGNGTFMALGSATSASRNCIEEDIPRSRFNSVELR